MKAQGRYSQPSKKTMRATTHTSLRIKNATKRGYLDAYYGDGVNISGRMDKGQRGNVQGGVSLTIKTTIDVGVVVYEED